MQDTLDWSRKWPVDFNDRKTELVLFDRSNITDAIDVKMDGSGLEKKNILLRSWGSCLYLLN